MRINTAIAALLMLGATGAASAADMPRKGPAYISPSYYDWTGFYRAVTADRLLLGPYQGGHGCLVIDFSRGVCGAAARTRTTQLVHDVEAFEGHIACSSSTRSEIVVPIVAPGGRLLGVLDVDSDVLAAFRDVDVRGLEALCGDLGRRFERTPSL